jgi:hypothetical protein
MLSKLTPVERDGIILHLVFGIVCVAVLTLPLGLMVGVRMFLLVLFYNVVTPLAGLRHPREEWFHIWLFSFIISLFQIMPDWFLSAQLGVLVFPDDGFVKIGDVSAYMAGLWTIPFFMIIFIGKRIKARFSETAALWELPPHPSLYLVYPKRPCG